MGRFVPNIESMRQTAERARAVWRRLKPGSLTQAEAEALIALGRLEQFMADVDTVIAASLGLV